MGNKALSPKISSCFTNHENNKEEDKAALIDIFNNTNGKRWKNKIYWCEDNIPLNQWHHIKELKGRVIRINLTDNNLEGSFPEIDSLDQLKDLQINQNMLSGEFPWSSLCSLHQLEIIDISDNRFTGTIPWDLLFTNLRQLKSISAANNYFQGSIPDQIMTDSSPKLHFFDMHQNELAGTLTTNTLCFIDFMRSSAYLYFDIRGNKSFYISENLTITAISITVPCLRLQHCSIYGNIPHKLSQVFSSVQVIDLSWNFLSGELPLNTLKDLPLISLNLEHNLFTGSLTDVISEFYFLKELNLGSNRLSGKLPKRISRLWQLRLLDLHSNQFSGPMPRLSHLTYLHTVHLDFNKFAGDEYTLYSQIGWEEYCNRKLLYWKKIKNFVLFIHCYGLMTCIPGTSINNSHSLSFNNSFNKYNQILNYAAYQAFAEININRLILQYL